MRNILILSVTILLFSCNAERKLKDAYVNYDEKLCLLENGKYLYVARPGFSYGTFIESKDSIILRSHYQVHVNKVEIQRTHVDSPGWISIRDKSRLVLLANVYINNIKYSYPNPNSPSDYLYVNDTIHVKTIEVKDILGREVSGIIDVNCDSCNVFNIYLDGYVYNDYRDHFTVFDDVLFLKKGDSLHVSSHDLDRLFKDNGGRFNVSFQSMKYSKNYKFKDVGLWCRDRYKQYIDDLKKAAKAQKKQ